MDLISRNYGDGSIKLADPRILAAGTSQKDNLHLGRTIKDNYREYFVTIMEKEIKYLTTEDYWEIIPNHRFHLQHT